MTISFPVTLCLIFVATVVAAPPPVPPDKSCREHPRLVGKCFTVRGRLATYAGNPAVRLQRFGTKRILGVSDQRFKEPGFSNIPDDLSRQLTGETTITGDFVVCPFTRSKPGEMQLVCIESAKNTVVKTGP
jgi:hypothetical protein